MRVKDLVTMFAKHNLTTRDMAALSGAHTVGFAHCTRFTHRLYRLGGGGGFGVRAAARAGVSAPGIAASMDLITPTAFENACYANLVNGLGLLTSDRALYADGASRPAVKDFPKNQTRFFKAAMVKMGKVGVKTGSGEIRKEKQ
jgi:peroxidase